MPTLRIRSLIAICAAVVIFLSPAIATSPDLGKTPQVLLLDRVDLPTGKVVEFVSIQSEIAKAYRDASVPVYWVALQSITGPPHILYFDGYDTFAQIEAAGAAISKAEQSHPDLARMQSDLAQLMQSNQAVINLRREDLSHRLDRFDIARFPFVRLTVIQLRSGYEQDFADALRTIRKAFETEGIDSPLAIFQVHSGMPAPAFIAVQLLTSLKEFDDTLEARKREYVNPFDFGRSKPPLLPKDAIASLQSDLYSVNLKISHIPNDAAALLSAPAWRNNSLYRSKLAVNPIPGTTYESYQQGEKLNAAQSFGSLARRLEIRQGLHLHRQWRPQADAIFF
jgi:hypothetical protein